MSRLTDVVRVVLVCALVFVGLGETANGQTSDRAAAESLFHEGRRLLEEGHYEKACGVLEASLDLDRAVGTLLNLARCHELSGRTASAWTLFGEAEAEARRANQVKRFALARSERGRVAPFVPRIIIRLAGAGSTSRVTLDGKSLGTGALDVPLALNPGVHTLRVEDDGRQPKEMQFELPVPSEGASSGPVEVLLELGPLLVAPAESTPPALVTDPGKPQDTVSVARASPLQVGETREASKTPSNARVWQWIGGISAGLGVALSATGIGLGVAANDRGNAADCDANDFCDDTGLEQREAARRQLHTAYVVGIVGAGVAVVGTVTWFAATYQVSKHSTIAATIRGGQGPGLILSGHF